MRPTTTSRSNELTDDEMMQGCLTVSEASKLCGVSRAEIYRMMDRREIAYRRCGVKMRRPFRASLDRWLRDRSAAHFSTG